MFKKCIGFTFILVLIHSEVSFASFCKSEKKKSKADQIALLGPSFKVSPIDLEIFPGGGVLAGYEYNIEPTYVKGLYTRYDVWRFQLKLNPSSVTDIVDSFDVGLNLNYDNEAKFLSYYDRPCDAFTAAPKDPRKMPLRSDRVLGDHFQPRDYFIFKGSTGVVLSSSLLKLITTPSYLSTKLSYFMHGFYQLHIIKLNQSEIRLKVVIQRSNGEKFDSAIGIDTNFEVFGIEKLDNKIEKWVNLKPIKLNVTNSDSKVFVVDYKLDLSQPEVAQAFDRVVQNLKSYKNISLVYPFSEYQNVADAVTLDLSPLEELYLRKNKPLKDQGIVRTLKADASDDSFGWSTQIGNKIFKFDYGQKKSTSHIKLTDKMNVDEYYIFKSWDKENDSRFFYSWRRNFEESSFRTLFLSDKDFKKLLPVSFVQSYLQKKNEVDKGGIEKFLSKLKRLLPVETYESIPWEKIKGIDKKKYSNFGINFKYFLSSQAILMIPSMKMEKISELLLDHLKNKKLNKSDFFFDYTITPKNIVRTAEEQFDNSLNEFSSFFELATNPDFTPEERLFFLSKLKENKLFNEIGFSFVLELNPLFKAQNHYVELLTSSNDFQLEFTYGDKNISRGYTDLLRVKSAMGDKILEEDIISLIQEKLQ